MYTSHTTLHSVHVHKPHHTTHARTHITPHHTTPTHTHTLHPHIPGLNRTTSLSNLSSLSLILRTLRGTTSFSRVTEATLAIPALTLEGMSTAPVLPSNSTSVGGKWGGGHYRYTHKNAIQTNIAFKMAQLNQTDSF